MHSILSLKHKVLGITALLVIAGVFGHMYGLNYIYVCFQITVPTFAIGCLLATISKALETVK